MANEDYVLENEIDLDAELDSIEDLPSFTTLHSGKYIVVLAEGIEEKEINGKSYFGVNGTVASVEEISEKLKEGEKEPVVGDIQSFLFDRKNKMAMDQFKRFFCLPIVSVFGGSKVKDAVENSRGLTMVWVGKRVYNKERDDFNFRLKATTVATE